MQQHGSKYCSRRHTATSGWVKRKNIFFSEINHVEDQNGVYLHNLLTLSYYQGSILCTLPTQYAPNIIILLR